MVSSGLLLTSEFVKIAYGERGYVAIGGEWLVLPILILLKRQTRDLLEEMRKWMETND